MNRRKHGGSRLQQRVTLQREIQTEDGTGGYIRSWQDVADLWAEIIPITGKEKWIAMQIQSSVTHRMLIRYRADIDASQRLVLNQRIFHIRSIANAGANNDILELLVEEGIAS